MQRLQHILLRTILSLVIGAIVAAVAGLITGSREAFIAAGVVAFIVTLPFRWTHPHRAREIDRRHHQQPISPEVTSLDTAANGYLAKDMCPDCHEPGHLYVGPSGGMSSNVACEMCGSEFNVGMLPGGPVLIDRLGKLSEARMRIYGITKIG